MGWSQVIGRGHCQGGKSDDGDQWEREAITTSSPRDLDEKEVTDSKV